MQYIIIDLEWNGSFSGRLGRYFNEIIEIGAVRLDEQLRFIDSFSVLVSPTFNKKLSGRVKRLTHITNSEVSTGMSFVKVWRQLALWVGSEENCFLSFGSTDIVVMLENLEAHGLGNRITFMHNYCDLQQLCQHAVPTPSGQQLGLSALAEKLGIEVGDMDMHRALDDSLVSAECMRKTFDPEVMSALSHHADDDFYGWLTFKTISISDINNPLVKLPELALECPVCGVTLKRLTAFTSKNRCFTAQFICGVCRTRYTGRHYIKLKYEGLVRRSTLTPAGSQTPIEVCGDASEDE